MQTDLNPVLIEEVEAPLDNAVQYRAFGQIAKRVGGAALALIMLFALPSPDTNKVIAENVSLASLACSAPTALLRRNTCDLPAIGITSSDLVAAAIKTQ